MKRILVVVLVLALLSVGLVGCAKEEAVVEEETAAVVEEEAAVEEEAMVEGYQIAMITDSGEIDDKSFNQGTWEGIIAFAEENGKTYKYYKPTEVSTNAYVAAIDLAVQGGAEVVVTPGYLFSTAVYVAQEKYPEISFIILDADPASEDGEAKITENTYAIYYAEQQSGFLAGYAAVKDGNTKLGFMGGMAVPAVVRFGYGYVQGAEYAAAEMGLDSVEIKYHYTGDFAATPANQAMAAAWYADGTEVIFGCGGKVGNSVMTAAETAGAKSIGVDVDQYAESDTVITSAMKDLAASVQAGLAGYFDGNFSGGKIETLDVAAGAVGLPMANSKFDTFSQADYDAIYAALVADTDGIKSSILKDTDVASADEIPTSIVSVTIVE